MREFDKINIMYAEDRPYQSENNYDGHIDHEVFQKTKLAFFTFFFDSLALTSKKDVQNLTNYEVMKFVEDWVDKNFTDE